MMMVRKQYIVLIDAGNVEDSAKIKNYIWNHWNTYTIDLAVCTHPDSDHKGGFFGLLNDRNVTIKEFWLNTPDDVITEEEYYQRYSRRDWLSHCRECYAHPTDTQSPNLVSLALEKCNKKVYGAYIGKSHSLIPLSVVGPTKEFYHSSCDREFLKIRKRKRMRIIHYTKMLALFHRFKPNHPLITRLMIARPPMLAV